MRRIAMLVRLSKAILLHHHDYYGKKAVTNIKPLASSQLLRYLIDAMGEQFEEEGG